MAETEDRPWVSYWWPLGDWPLRPLWRHSMCRLGVHLFDEVYSFGPGLLDVGAIALAESATGTRVTAALTGDPAVDEREETYLYCDACGLAVNTTGLGYY